MILAIDPGKSGGLVTLHPDGTIHARKMPATERDLWDDIRSCGADVAVIEFVRSSPQMGVTSAFTFGRNYGTLRGLVIASGMRLIEVMPREWQKGLRLPTKKAAGSDSRKKAAHKARAQERFPGVKVTHAVADALLIAEWAAREVGATSPGRNG